MTTVIGLAFGTPTPLNLPYRGDSNNDHGYMWLRRAGTVHTIKGYDNRLGDPNVGWVKVRISDCNGAFIEEFDIEKHDTDATFTQSAERFQVDITIYDGPHPTGAIISEEHWDNCPRP